MKKKIAFVTFICLFSLITINLLPSNTQAQGSFDVLLVGEEIPEYLLARISLDPSFIITTRDSIGTGSLSIFDSIMILDYAPSLAEISNLESFTGGVSIFIYENLASNATLLTTLGLASTTTNNVVQEVALPVPVGLIEEHSILNNIQWNSVPSITNYTDVQLAGTIILKTAVYNESETAIALASTIDSEGYFAFNFYPNMEFNSELIDWPFFNYMIYLTLMSSVNEVALSYANWDYSPVPHALETILIGVAVLVTAAITTGGFIYARKYSKKNPLKDKDLEEMSKEVKSEDKWEEVGMHRQLGGFLIQLFVGLLVILPNVVMSALVFPLLVLPSPQAAGFYDYTIKFFEALWLFFDLGTSVVLVKFFSEHRVKSPKQAIKYVQIFVWYQMLSGIAQLFLISFIGSMVFPHTFLAHMSWVIVTHAFFQWPAFFLVFMYLFQAMNRIDLQQILNLLLYAVFNITLQYLVIILFRYTLGKNPVFGDGLAGAIGYSVGFYVIQIASFLVGLLFFKRLGFSLVSIFRIDFTWVDLKEAFKFGAKWMVGKILPPLGWFMQLYLMSFYLPNYTQQQGYFSLAWNFASIVMLVALFAESFLPAISESYHAKKKALTRYYTISSLKWSAYFDWFLVAVLIPIGWRFISGGAGEQWIDAAPLIIWFLFFHSIGYFSWLGDWMFAGSDRPAWAAISWVIEQVIRISLLFVFIPLYGFFDATFGSPMVAIMFAYFPALIIKNIFMWWGIRRDDYFKFKWKDLLWQGFAAPLFAAVVIWGLFEGLFSLIWFNEIISSVVILLVGTLGGLYVFAFVASFFGAFDDNTLEELRQASLMAKGLQFMAKPLFIVSKWGAKISPLHNRFPISVFEEASAEAKQLTEEKAKLVI
ncbi:MAG: lipopolysaccharide biosynthesis protein [Candidatus Heimdallarchaeota archaeon]|nr:lipopolysaccharide biosynthesis protein [Candidatus Heimdallarchaeota archaeon]